MGGRKEILTKNGCFNFNLGAKCVIFPKGKTTWEGFQRPFKDGDILATDLGSVFYLNTRLNTNECYGCYVGKGGDGSFHICEPFAYKECCGLATEEEKQKLFKAIKDNGYKWNAETKTLEELEDMEEKEETMETITIDDFKANTKEWLIDKLESMSKDNALQTINNIYDELHKPKYPKTYEECCKIKQSDPNFYIDTHLYSDKLDSLYKLLICRDAYWKIAESMGLNRPWEPDWKDDEQFKYIIICRRGC